MFSRIEGNTRVNPYIRMIAPDIYVQVALGIAINAVETLSKNVNTKIATIADRSIRRTLPLSHHATPPPKITGITGRTHGARTDRIHEKNEMMIVSIK
jgi:hypothetical protein